jgi:2,4-didehydro-3-deoxy-L-rhamnonate hydrolase
MTPERRSTRPSAAPPDRVVLAQATRSVGHQANAASARPWLVRGDMALPLAAVAPGGVVHDAVSIHDLLVSWDAVAPVLQDLIEAAQTRKEIQTHGTDVAELVVMSPVQPGQTFCTIGNYAGQVVEAAVDAGDGPFGRGAAARRDAALVEVEQRKQNGQPYICLTSSHRVTGPRRQLTLPADVQTLDWEVEVAAVVGAGGSGNPVVAGYCLANDLTVRSRVLRTDVAFLSDWVQSKGMSGSLPMGPWFVPAWQVPDVSALRLQLHLNGTLMQDDLAADMIFGVDEQISYLARHTALAAGDVVCTGSPAGFGAHHRRFLQPGDEVRSSVAELGEQVLSCVAQAADEDPGMGNLAANAPERSSLHA